MMDQLAHYIEVLSRMRTHSNKSQYSQATRYCAPNKPLLLLAILDQFEQGMLTSNFVPLSPDLADLFALYWDLTMPADHVGHMFLPFFHMKNDGFWQLVPRPGEERVLGAIRQIGGNAQLGNLVVGGLFDEGLFNLIQVKTTRDVLRAAIIERYFDVSLQSVLHEQTNTNRVAHQYSLDLLEQARKQREPGLLVTDDIQQPVRDQGFRKAIVAAYNHRCVLCGVRLVTYEGRTAATAAHIVPWSVSHNDDPRNGLCLCHLCHWTFDVGLTTITMRYRIRLSSQVNQDGNMPGYLSTLDDRPIFDPIEEAFNPDIEALVWHKEKVFLG